MSCNTRYWHSMAMSQPDRPSNPALAKENNNNLQALIAARQAQDAKLWAPLQEQGPPQTRPQSQAK